MTDQTRPETASTGRIPGRLVERGRSKAHRPVPAAARERAVARGLAAYDRGAFYLAHEEFEPAWMGTDDPSERALLGGLIKLAAAFVHAERGNPLGLRTNLAGALDRLADAARADGPDAGLDLPALVLAVGERLEEVQTYLALSGTSPARRPAGYGGPGCRSMLHRCGGGTDDDPSPAGRHVDRVCAAATRLESGGSEGRGALLFEIGETPARLAGTAPPVTAHEVAADRRSRGERHLLHAQWCPGSFHRAPREPSDGATPSRRFDADRRRSDAAIGASPFQPLEGAPVSPSEYFFLAAGLVLGIGVGAALTEVLRARPAARREVRVTVAPAAVPGRTATLATTLPDWSLPLIDGGVSPERVFAAGPAREVAGQPGAPGRVDRVAIPIVTERTAALARAGAGTGPGTGPGPGARDGPGAATARPDADPCAALRLALEERCGHAERMAAMAAAAAERHREARRAYDEHVVRRDRAAATMDPRAVRAAKDEAQASFRLARVTAGDRDAVETAARGWLREVN